MRPHLKVHKPHTEHSSGAKPLDVSTLPVSEVLALAQEMADSRREQASGARELERLKVSADGWKRRALEAEGKLRNMRKALAE
ncbi:hypothetical protein [Streptomyces nanshensis]|uniref:Uncharacterized protein n=1 Tax=Streptomyces nanshensis TaxID=518642 RepID=A0A1E7L8R3_9ACTN|nr:hypothetical protein [Streptomyces nanshensis]OEV12579.1 hypothetical protein AN218_07600 [Streptomyces nanshensis]